MIAIDEALARLIALAPPIAREEAPLARAAGRWLADDVMALRTQPAHDLSAMDGYALRFADLDASLTVIGESAAGRPFPGRVEPGQAVRIFTGAAVPAGADTVLVQEEAAIDGTVLRLAGEGPGRAGRHIRRAGLDFHAGDTIVRTGERIGAARIGLAALAGLATLPVRRPVRVALFGTGDEIGAGPDALPDSNTPMLAAALRDLPVEIVARAVLPDDLHAIAAALGDTPADLIVTTGGASVGDHDLVRPAIEAAGGRIDFWKIAMRPGKPMLAGRIGDAMIVGLPGNPVAAFVTTHRFVRPLLAAMSGGSLALSPRRLPLGAPLPANDRRADHLRGVIRDDRVFPAPTQDSSMLATLAASDCLILRAPFAPTAPAGESVEILDLA
ncbi:molybdopterin molybdotransferase MoeA [Sphingomonas baiyangensis]|uniref:Molybdopterin molybdenumtransferase n=1 Tax=Sphingomonas baiyangensis TaxID=2572576 RepID=A0A4U1L092_9SPHN|nr:molybdopterin molybdotransferase MoeA [Sphingomonas baiyangensis]TKD50127.1 molybdopterin molybdotransferase MoeA [Sphingomonas baiyangensis]